MGHTHVIFISRKATSKRTALINSLTKTENWEVWVSFFIHEKKTDREHKVKGIRTRWKEREREKKETWR